jgi:hypothetical protein
MMNWFKTFKPFKSFKTLEDSQRRIIRTTTQWLGVSFSTGVPAKP